MAKKYISKTTGTETITKARNIVVAAPYDVRGVVETYADLLDKDTYSYSELYVGMLVITYDTQDVYVLSKLPGSRDNATAWAQNIKWKKVNYAIDSIDDLEDIENPYVGQFAYVKDDSNTSEDESGLYIYNGDTWVLVEQPEEVTIGKISEQEIMDLF